jgi:hypothetical protein
VVVNGLRGRVTLWTSCAGTTISLSEARLGNLYVQVKQAGGPDLTERVLATVHS